MDPLILAMLGMLNRALLLGLAMQKFLLDLLQEEELEDPIAMVDGEEDPFEDDNHFQVISAVTVLTAAARLRRPARRFWVCPRQRTQWDNIDNHAWNCLPSFEDDMWHQHYRMKRCAFERLVGLVAPYLIRPGQKVRPPVDPRKAIAMVLYFLAHGEMPLHVAERFYVGKATVQKYTKKITLILASKTMLYKKFIALPSGQRLADITKKFEDATGLPNIFGAVDGSHIFLYRKPWKKDKGDDYYSRHKRHSCLMQGVVDHSRMFLNVCVSRTGSVHDSNQFKKSLLYRRLASKQIMQQPIIQMSGKKINRRGEILDRNVTVNIPPLLLGDSAYPSRKFLLKVFPESTGPYKLFNKRICKGRVCVENGFGIVKEKFRILKALPIHVGRASKIIHAACVLWNFCTMQDLGMEMLEVEPDLPEVDYYETEQMNKKMKKEGDIMRHILLQNRDARNLF